MKTITNILSGVMLFFCGMAPAGSADVIRIASYNIKFLTTGVVNQGNRLDKLKQVIQLVDADVYGFQEISNRAALELLFPQSDWDIRIDDSSGDAQDLAVAVRKARLKVKTDRFLFPSSADDNFFPNHRDLLCVDLQFPNSTTVFSVIVHHAKSRLDGRNTTDPRREGAAKKMVDLFKQDFQDKDFVLLGDFNDNPDDRSLNILELGDAGAFGAAEEMDGPFLINLMELLC